MLISSRHRVFVAPFFAAGALLLSVNTYSQTLVSVEMHKYVDPQGRTHYSDRAMHDGYVKLVKTVRGWQTPIRAHDYEKHRDIYRPFIVSISERYQVSPVLTEAVIHVESYFDPEAVSRAGAMGLMQLMPATARRYGVFNRRNAIKNIEGGVQYLRDLMVMFDNDLELVLAAYNAGEAAVKRYGNQIPPYSETQNYVKKVRLKMHKLNTGA
ncbi:lytic transglycosylase domain-containing protein [Teredinibacter purpureus]|uniref:lytic transglycosylase domain-containing protein n=1 Tax=Teredinibacter purpureus TaxID=2731756 RepID=UPI0005F7C32A|nr:lytic transglycosylase domain-containing protein [Teredinibacter purpureus]